MCGIAGFWDYAGNVEATGLQTAAAAMADSLRHRGPDDGGVWTDARDGIALGHRRLAILELSELGRQPMRSRCGRYVIAFNGEIYNFKTLRHRVEAAGHRFRGGSDTEVMLASFAEWGLEAALQSFNGMFAFALWDAAEHCLYLARDRAGEKPLYYRGGARDFQFASELKAFRIRSHAGLEIDRDALALFMRHGYVPAPYSIYRGVRKLPAGCWMRVRRGGGGEPVPYWAARDAMLAAAEAPFAGDAEEAREKLDALLREAVRLRMAADVPLGAFLSGGVDSSTVVSLMQAQSGCPVRTFTIGFRESDYNEAEKARRVARHLGTEHTELYLGPRQALEVIPRLPTIYDEPFADSSQIPTFLVSEMARRHVTVSLSGDAGDELFGGYKMYQAGRDLWRVIQRVPPGCRRKLAQAIRATPVPVLDRLFGWMGGLQRRYGRAGSIGDKLQKLASILPAERPEDMHRRMVSHWRDPEALVREAREPLTAYTNPAIWLAAPDVATRMMFLDFVMYLPDDILAKLDRASMAVSLESRVPFLDPRVIEFAWRLPLAMKFRQGQSKWILRQVLYRYVPPSVVDQPKAGFAIPLSSWLRGPLRQWAEDLLSESTLRQDGYFDAVQVRQALAEHFAGVRNWEQPLWNVLTFQAWLGQHRSSPGVERYDCSLVA